MRWEKPHRNSARWKGPGWNIEVDVGSVSVITGQSVIFIIILLQKYHLDGTVTYEVDKLDQDLLVVTYLLFGAGEEHQVSSMSINIITITVVKISSTISNWSHRWQQQGLSGEFQDLEGGRAFSRGDTVLSDDDVIFTNHQSSLSVLSEPRLMPSVFTIIIVTLLCMLCTLHYPLFTQLLSRRFEMCYEKAFFLDMSITEFLKWLLNIWIGSTKYLFMKNDASAQKILIPMCQST